MCAVPDVNVVPVSPSSDWDLVARMRASWTVSSPEKCLRRPEEG